MSVPNQQKVPGVHIRRDTLNVNMAAYDRLPASWRKALGQAKFAISPVSVEALVVLGYSDVQLNEMLRNVEAKVLADTASLPVWSARHPESIVTGKAHTAEELGL